MNFTSEIGSSFCSSFSFTSKRRITHPNPNPSVFSLAEGGLLRCRTKCASDTAAKQTQFPPDLIQEILLRLSVKSLLRFKCLSKQWLFLLSNRQFITTHLKIQTSLRTPQEFIVQNYKNSNLFIGTLNDNADAVLFRPLQSNFQVPPSEQQRSFLGHCNGLVSAHFSSKETDWSSIVVWNPSTMEHRRFPLPQCRQKNIERFGFGYDSVSDDYKLVVATSAEVGTKLPFRWRLDNVQSLSLKTGLWKTTQRDAEYLFDLSGTATESKHVNGCIYWLINREGRIDCGIASFDLASERMGEEESLSLMLYNESKMYAALDLVGDSLCLAVSPDEVTYDIWMMEENGVTHTKSWMKLFRVHNTDGNFTNPLDDPWNRGVISPVCFSRNGKVLIFSNERHEYALYEPNDRSVVKVPDFGNPIVESWPVSPYVESLVSPGR